MAKNELNNWLAGQGNDADGGGVHEDHIVGGPWHTWERLIEHMGSDPCVMVQILLGAQNSYFNGPKSVNSDKQSLVVDCQWFGMIMRTILGLKMGCGN